MSPATLRIYFDPQGARSPGWAYRFEWSEGHGESGPIDSLDTLADVLRRWGHGLAGLPWTELPTFGGRAPHPTDGVWSWDETRLLVGRTASDVTLLPRLEPG